MEFIYFGIYIGVVLLGIVLGIMMVLGLFGGLILVLYPLTRALFTRLQAKYWMWQYDQARKKVLADIKRKEQGNG